MPLFSKNLKYFAEIAVDAVLPPRCIVSGDFVDRQGMITASAWKELRFIAPPFCVSCGTPLSYTLEYGTLCASCAAWPPPFDKARAALVYDDGSKDMILRFKYADQTHAVHSFVPWLLQAGKEFLDMADYIVPVPLHRTRLLKRRYNQAALIAQALCRAEGVSAAYLPEALLRYKKTETQGTMNFRQRRKNVKNAFMVPPAHRTKLQGRNIVLVDDVYTTGATVKECAKVLKKAGAGKIYVLALARVVKDGTDY